MYERFEELLRMHNVTAYKVAKETGVSTATLSCWKKGTYIPKRDKLQKIADYFGVSIDYLTNGITPEHTSTEGNKYYFDDESAELADFAHKNPEYKALFDASRNVKPEDINFVLEMIKRTSNNDD